MSFALRSRGTIQQFTRRVVVARPGAIATSTSSSWILPQASASTTAVRPAALFLNNAVIRQFSSVQQELVEILERECGEEKESLVGGTPPDLAELRAKIEKDWKVVESGAMTKLVKTSNTGLKIQIAFHCQDAAEISNDDFVEEALQGENEDVGAMRFTVTATKAGKTLVLTCLSENAMGKIDSVAVTAEDVETILTNSGVSRAQYQGPSFIELAEDLQDAFHNFLEEECGVNEDVASFVVMNADYREQREYVKFLDDSMSVLR